MPSDVPDGRRAGKGFTVLQAYVLRGLGTRHPDGEISLAGATPLVDRDPSRPNEAFFRNVDHLVRRANELGLVMGLVATYGEHVRAIKSQEQVFTPERTKLPPSRPRARGAY